MFTEFYPISPFATHESGLLDGSKYVHITNKKNILQDTNTYFIFVIAY